MSKKIRKPFFLHFFCLDSKLFNSFFISVYHLLFSENIYPTKRNTSLISAKQQLDFSRNRSKVSMQKNESQLHTSHSPAMNK